MATSQNSCVDAKTFVFDKKKIVSFRCFSDGTIEKHDYIAPEWNEIGNGSGAEKYTGECMGFSIEFLDDKSFLAIRWFKDGTVQQAHPFGSWSTLK